MSRNIVFRLVALCLFPVVAVAQAASAQAPEEDAGSGMDETFYESIGVEVISIDVVVTDKKGRAIQGLAADDFELRIDGQKVPIANFYGVAGAPAPTPAAPTPRLAGAPGAGAPAAAPGDELSLIVYLDGPYLLPQSRRRLLRDLPAFLEEQVTIGTRVMLVYREQTTQVLTPFTTDLNELLTALEQARKAPATTMRRITARRLAMNNIRESYESCLQGIGNDPCTSCIHQMIELARIYSIGVINERRNAMAALGGLVNALAVLEGKKALLHASDGIEQQGGIDLFYYIGDQLCPNSRGDVQEHYIRQDIGDLTDLVNQANASRVTFYTLEAAGMRGFSSASAEYDSQFFVPSAQNDLIRIANLQSSLYYMADETGGKAILNASKFTPDLAKLTGEMRSYYSLGYEPQHAGRSRTHRVSVKVPKKKGVDVRYRRTFLHKKPDQLLADKALGTIMLGVTENPLGAEVSPGSQSPMADGRVQVALEVRVPLARLALIPQGETRVGRLKVIITAPDDKGRTVVRKKEIDLSLPVAANLDGAYSFGVNVELEPGEHRLGVSLWDDLSGTGSVLALPIRVDE